MLDSSGKIGVVGINASSGKHVRPLTAGKIIEEALLKRAGGCFDMGEVLHLGSVTPCGSKPHMEDCVFDPQSIQRNQSMNGSKFFQLMMENAAAEMTQIFGSELKAHGMSGWMVPAGTGSASIGLLAPIEPPELWVKPRPGDSDQLRITFRDRTMTRDLPVCDLRLFHFNTDCPDEDKVDKVNDAIQSERKVVLGLTLSRLDQNYHWLQVSAVHWRSDSVWCLNN
jgi:hypothetical protein